jgi:hypothetical protein
VLFGNGDHPELSEALEVVLGPASSWLSDLRRQWEALRHSEHLLPGDSPRWPIATGPWTRPGKRTIVRIAIFPTETQFTRQLTESVFATSWELALDKDAFDQWMRPILEERVHTAVDGW